MDENQLSNISFQKPEKETNQNLQLYTARNEKQTMETDLYYRRESSRLVIEETNKRAYSLEKAKKQVRKHALPT